jgi:hypothetical protein
MLGQAWWCLPPCHPLAVCLGPWRVPTQGVLLVPQRLALGPPGPGFLWVPRHLVLMHCLVILRSSDVGVYGELTPTSPCFGSELGGTGVRVGAYSLGLLLLRAVGFLQAWKRLCYDGWRHRPLGLPGVLEGLTCWV